MRQQVFGNPRPLQRSASQHARYARRSIGALLGLLGLLADISPDGIAESQIDDMRIVFRLLVTLVNAYPETGYTVAHIQEFYEYNGIVLKKRRAGK